MHRASKRQRGMVRFSILILTMLCASAAGACEGEGSEQMDPEGTPSRSPGLATGTTYQSWHPDVALPSNPLAPGNGREGESTEARSGDGSRGPPTIIDLWVSSPTVLRTRSLTLRLNVSDDIDPAQDLDVTGEHRVNGSSSWSNHLLGPLAFTEGAWQCAFSPRVDDAVGPYDVRFSVEDTGGNCSGFEVFPNCLEVKNNLPTAAVVRIMPDVPNTMTTLITEIVTPATDVETGVTYVYKWFRDGALADALTGDAVASAFTSRGENWSVEVRAHDGLDEGPPARAWVFIRNAPPHNAIALPSPEFPEDTIDDQSLDLSQGFTDPDGDALAYSVSVPPEHIEVTIDPSTGRVTLCPAKDWYGQESLTFNAWDGEFTINQTVLVTVTPVNDAPRFTSLDGKPITTDPVLFEVPQDATLVITVGAEDVEDDELVFSVSTTMVEVDAVTGVMRFTPNNDMIGTLRFSLMMCDVVSPSVRVQLNITVNIVNVNDPPEDPRITNPNQGDRFKVNQTISLIGTCTDPDTPYGQVLSYTWSWNGTNLIGIGSSITVSFADPGTYDITLEVSDGEYSRSDSFEIVIEPDLPDSDEDGMFDASDAFPFDPAASIDTDEDGYPDDWNAGSTKANSTTGLELDRFPQDPAASIDTDGDGHPDRWNPGRSRADSTTGLELDYYPYDALRWEKETKRDSSSLSIVGVLGGLFVTAIMYVRWRKR